MGEEENLANEHYHAHAHSHSHTSTIIEKRAPTDESVKLLREMEQAAEARIIQSIRTPDNLINCEILQCREYVLGSSTFYAIMSINGEKITVKHTPDFLTRSFGDAMVELRDLIAKEIASNLIIDATKKMELPLKR